MKKQTLLILTLIVLSFKITMAQQIPNVNYFMYDHARTNPGSLGSKDMVCASLIFRESTMGIEGSPQNVLANVETPFNLFGMKHGVGLSVYNDEIGFNSDINVKIGYALRFNVADGTLGIGFNGNLYQHTLNTSEFEVGDLGEEDDPYIPQGSQENLQSFGVGVGLFYRSEDIYLGASVANVYSSDIEYESDPTSTTANSSLLQMRPHYYLTAGYTFQLSNPAYEIEPSVLFFSDGVSTTFDLNGTLTYNKRIWGGVSYRAGSPASAVIGMIGFMVFDGLKVGGAYEYNTSALSSYSNGGFEVLLNYCFKLGVEKSPKRYRSVRYL